MSNKKWISAGLVTVGAMMVIGCGTATPSGTSGTKGSSDTGNTSNTANQSAGAGAGTATTKVTYPLTLTDEAGHKVTIQKQPKHIASVTLGTDEILSALVPKKEIAMVTTYATDPSESNIVNFAKGIPTIKTANAEQIIAANPDLVLAASYTQAGVVKQLEQAGIPTYEFAAFNSQQDIEKNIEIVGKLVGEPSKAKKLVQTMNQQLKAIESAVKGQPKVTVLDDSSYGMVAGNGTTVNDMIVDAGGTNVAAGVSNWTKVSDEQIVKWNPDVMIIASNDTGYKQKLLNDKALQDVNFVKNDHIYAIDAADLTSLSQYFTKGVRDVAKALHPNVKIPQ